MIIEAHAMLGPDGSVIEQVTALVDNQNEPDLSTAAGNAEVMRTEALIAPGLIDTHVHGGGGGDLASTDPEQIRRAVRFHLDHGTTSLIAGVVTDELATIEAQLAVLAELSRAGEIAGIHLETPFLSAVKCGAHPPELLLAPDASIAERLLSASGGELTMITIAPELPGALAIIEQFVAAGVHVAIGHTNATVDQTRAAIEAGASVATHLFNAMPQIHHRNPGPVPLLLSDPRVAVELICDGIHLAPEVVAAAVAAAGVERTMLITDAISAAGLGDGRYVLGQLAVSVAAGQARLIDATGELGSIAGSTLTLADAVRFVVEHTHADCSLAIRMASTTPALVHQLVGVGQIAPGCRADLTMWDSALNVTGVMRAGRWHRQPVEMMSTRQGELR